MDILSQYYNESGQIVSRTPDLTTREFYRDYLCRHRFNEMFVVGKQFSGPTYSAIGDYVFYTFGGGSGERLPVHIPSEEVPYGGVATIPGKDGRRALITDSNSSTINTTIYDGDHDNFSPGGGISVGIIFRSPIDQSETASGPFWNFIFSFVNSEDAGNSEPSVSFIASFYKYIQYNKYAHSDERIEIRAIINASSLYYGRVAERASFLTDGLFHLLSINYNNNGTVIVEIDGQPILDFSINTQIVRCSQPKIANVLWGATNPDSLYALDTAWIKKI